MVLEDCRVWTNKPQSRTFFCYTSGGYVPSKKKRSWKMMIFRLAKHPVATCSFMFRWIGYQQIRYFLEGCIPMFWFMAQHQTLFTQKIHCWWEYCDSWQYPHQSSLKQEPWASLSSSSCLAPCILWSSIIPRWTVRCCTPRTRPRSWVASLGESDNKKGMEDSITYEVFFVLGWREGSGEEWHDFSIPDIPPPEN